MTFFRKTSPKSIGFRWIRWYDEHLLKYVSLVFWTSIFVGLKVPFVSFVWGTFKDMYLHTTLLHYLLPIDADDDDNEWMNEMKEVCNINTPLNQQFPKRFPLPTEKKNIPFKTADSTKHWASQCGDLWRRAGGLWLGQARQNRFLQRVRFQYFSKGPPPHLLVIHGVLSPIDGLINGWLGLQPL